MWTFDSGRTYIGLSTDTKPTDAIEGATFSENDTAKAYEFYGGVWTEISPGGSTGSSGSTGPQGGAGPQGAQGSAGIAGEGGSVGVQGATGPAGKDGPQGVTGPVAGLNFQVIYNNNNESAGATGLLYYPSTQAVGVSGGLTIGGVITGTTAYFNDLNMPPGTTEGFVLHAVGSTGQTVWKRKALSMGCITKPDWTDNHDGTVSIDSFYANLNTKADGSGPINVYYFAASGPFTLTDFTNNYIFADYNTGTPIVRCSTDVSLINERTTIPVITFSMNDVVGSITGFADAGGGKVTATTSTVHLMESGGWVVISDTSNYDGVYQMTAVGSNTFTFTHSFVATETGSYDHYTTIAVNWDELGEALANKLNRRFIKTERFVRESGLEISVSGLTPTISSGVIWYGGIELALNGFTAGDPGTYWRFWYHSGGNWKKDETTLTLNNSYYDNGTNLVALTASYYVCNWIYRVVSDERAQLRYILGGQYKKLGDAQSAAAPSPPPFFASTSVLVARVITQQGNASYVQLDSAFTSTFDLMPVTDHSSLVNLSFDTADHTYFLGQDRVWSPVLQEIPYVTGPTHNSGPVFAGNTGFIYDPNTGTLYVNIIQANYGLTGPQGFQGNQGLTGPQGYQGLTGPQGNQGVQGGTGPWFPQTFGQWMCKSGILYPTTGSLRWYPYTPSTITSVTACLGVAPSGQAVLVDVNKNGTSILASPLSVTGGAYTSDVTTPSTTAMGVTDYLTVDVDQVGIAEPGRDLSVRIIYSIP